MLLTLLLNYQTNEDPYLGAIAALIGIALTIALLAVSISALFDKATRKRGLIGLGISLLILGLVALAVYR